MAVKLGLGNHRRGRAPRWLGDSSAPTGSFQALLTPEDAVLSDELNHASIIDGIRLCKAHKFRYRHLDMADLEAKLQEAQVGQGLGVLGPRAGLIFKANPTLTGSLQSSKQPISEPRSLRPRAFSHCIMPPWVPYMWQALRHSGGMNLQEELAPPHAAL